MFNKPYDIVVMVALFAAVVVTMGFGLQAVQDRGATIDDAAISTYFESTNSRVSNTSFFAGTTTEGSEALVGTVGMTDEESGIDDLITRGLSSMLSIGRTYAFAQESLLDAQGLLGIPAVYVTLVIGVVLITLMVIIYTWLRGS